MTESLYKIELLTTAGWELFDDNHPTSPSGEVYDKLTKEQCKEKYDGLVQSGENPNRLRVVRVS